MKTYVRLVFLALAALLSVAGILVTAIHYAELQYCSGFLDEKSDDLSITFQMQSDEVEFPSHDYDTVGRTLTRSNPFFLVVALPPNILLHLVQYNFCKNK